VESRVPLPISREFTVRVEETEPKVILKLLSPQAPGELQLSSLLKKYLGSDVSLEFLADRLSLLAKGGFQEIPPSVKGSLENFRSSLRSLPDLSALQPETLRALAEKSGIFWENKIKNWMEGTRGEPLSRILQEDLKGLGMKLLAELQGAGGQEGDPLRVEILKRDLEAFLLKVELYQVLNLRNPEPTDRLYLIFPFWLGSHLQMAELNLSFPKKERRPEGEEEFSLLFLLNLPSWGKLRIEVQIRERALFCRFWVGDAQAAESIRLGLSALKTRLEKLGFEPHLQASVDGEEIPTGAVAQELGKEAPSLLSVMI
jgi:transcriptional regulator with XRE-family HTH domain